jgi:hypothetical protein
MKLRWHLLWSMILAGGTFAILDKLGAGQAVAFGVAAGVFVFYWLILAGLGGSFDLGDFLD